MFWNLENLFDWHDSEANVADKEFSSRGSRHWTRSRFQTKINLIAKAILWTADNQAHLPDIIGFAEVENFGVLRRLVKDTALARLDYGIVHYDSDDPRGIDCALLYRKDRFRVLSSGYVRPQTLRTRDILYVTLQEIDPANPQIYNVIVNHHPSKFSGAATSDKSRIEVMKLMCHLADSLSKRTDYYEVEQEVLPVIAMGDFNDNPDGESFKHVFGLRNEGLDLFERGEGTIRFGGKWDLIDLFFTKGLEAGTSEKGIETKMTIVKIPFLRIEDRQYGGEKPFRTYVGKTWTGGVSDHCPILLTIRNFVGR